jgi:ferritin-like protein
MSEKPTDTGTNRTGIATSPIDSRRLIEAAEQAGTAGPLDGRALEAERVRWARDADPIGTVPPPGTLKGLAKTALEVLQGHKPTVFIDKLGERLAYERTGTRLYDALLAKHAAASVHGGGPTRAELEKIRDEEHQHVLLVADAIRRLGADPTAMTPSADLVGVAGLGWVQALTDPRTTLTQCLDVMLIAEQGDVAGWELLTELAAGLGFEDLAQQFNAAGLVEEEHAAKVHTWLSRALLGQSGVLPTPPHGEHVTQRI